MKQEEKGTTMKELIDKSLVIAEIERLQDFIKATAIDDRISKEQAEAYKVCVKLRSFVEDTLETKEVDMEKEISNYFDNHNLNIQDGGRIVFSNGDTPNLLCDFRNIAKHFFVLGLKAQKL